VNRLLLNTQFEAEPIDVVRKILFSNRQLLPVVNRLAPLYKNKLF
jgi:hypothetical protein